MRGNGKIIQELETIFRGAGWNVIKVIWGDRWDPLLEADHDGLLVKRMEEAVDGEYQVYKARDGAYVREHFFGKYPELAERVEDMTDEEIWDLNRGGHDAKKVYAAYAAAQAAEHSPTVILAKTIKGYGMGEAGEGQNITHQQKKMNEEALRAFRDRFELEISDEEVEQVAFHKPPGGLGRRSPTCASAARRSAGRPARAPAPGRRAAPGSAARDLLIAARGHRRARDLDDDGVRPHPRGAASRQASWARGSSRSSPTSRGPSGWRGCSASSGSTPTSASCTSPRTPTS